jgi:hypothetical protein
MWLHIWLLDAAINARLNRQEDSSAAVYVSLMLILPGLLVALGSFLQTICYQRWALLIVCIGAITTAGFVGVNMLFVFAYTVDNWGQLAVIGDLLLLALTVPLGILNVLPESPPRRLHR